MVDASPTLPLANGMARTRLKSARTRSYKVSSSFFILFFSNSTLDHDIKMPGAR
jgi:hypothetical protein